MDTTIQMQVIDNLLVVHHIDKRTSLIYDLKLQDYHLSLTGDECEVKVEKALNGVQMSELIEKEE